MDKNKLILPVSILLGCIILGGFYYVSEVNKQKSIEKQQQIELQAKTAQDQANASTTAQNLLAQEKQKCSEDGGKFFQQFYANNQNTDPSSKVTWSTPKYHFDTRLQACLMFWETTSVSTLSDGSILTMPESGVIDVNSSITILSSTNNLHDNNKYLQQKDILMSE
jgi:hypothetical protein